MAKSKTKQRPPDGRLVIASNKRARYDFDILDTIEAGMVLTGSEVKSLREGNVRIGDAYARAKNGEMWLESMHVPPYQSAVGFGAHDPDRSRKLLMHRAEIRRLEDRIARERVTLVPLSLYFRDGRAKIELGVAKGRARADKRQAIAERDAQRDIERELGRRRKQLD